MILMDDSFRSTTIFIAVEFDPKQWAPSVLSHRPAACVCGESLIDSLISKRS